MALALQACSYSVNADREQCAVDADCQARGGAFAGSVCLNSVCVADSNWSCLVAPPAAPSAPGPFKAAIRLIDLVSQQPLSGVSARLCNKIDVTCNAPRSIQKTDLDGAATFQVELGFTGYLVAEKVGLKRALYFFNPPIERDELVTLSSSHPPPPRLRTSHPNSVSGAR